MNKRNSYPPLKEWGPLALYIWTTIEKQNNEKRVSKQKCYPNKDAVIAFARQERATKTFFMMTIENYTATGIISS